MPDDDMESKIAEPSASASQDPYMGNDNEVSPNDGQGAGEMIEETSDTYDPHMILDSMDEGEDEEPEETKDSDESLPQGRG